ncbi:proteasome activator subunit 4 [Coniosporium apollinis CBS 100218]|uniref:Proteasome activator subunit 4 n=1 Tax=Coniosporium apollinis (strain CBS 100218) TaxID=1168221 RepID=R7Z4L5_CONA1|nr:proteasome activator subunit 4 [Coniosporium apollinis CBS 100218]EON69048.1 proteasome activator subunit 4 [Coniosporium apollinis CBS 100218]
MANDRLAALISALDGPAGNDISRATSPGGDWTEVNGGVNGQDQERQSRRGRPRTFPYSEYLPYPVEDHAERLANLDTCIKHLYIAVSAGDFSPGAVHWTREIRGWMSLKFDLPWETRVKLVKLYYEMALAPGLDYVVAERFASMFMVLTKRKHYLRPVRDLTLDWRPLYKELKNFVLPAEGGASHTASIRRNIRTLTKLSTFSQLFFDPNEIPEMLKEFLSYFSTSFTETAYVVAGLLNLLLPTTAPPPDKPELQPQYYLPTFFHLWSLVGRSKQFDVHFIDIFSRLARDSLSAPHISYSEYGIFTGEQSSLIFTAVLRLLDIPVGQATSPYSSTVDLSAGLALLLNRDDRKHPSAHHIARWIIMSLSPACAEKPDSILSKLEGLIEAIETFFHPSNSGSWTKPLSQLTYYLTDFFVMRWNRERNGEMEVPEERRLNDAVKKRFVLCMREVIFMGIFAKSSTAITFSLSTLQSLAFLEPNLILPGALQRIYPAMQGLVEVHRTITSIRSLQMLSKVMARSKGYRCHITTLLGLALPGIDANDLDKTMHTLAFIQAIAYQVPFVDLTQERKPKRATDNLEDGDGTETPSEGHDTGVAMRWITAQVERLETEGADIEIDYETELTDHEEEMILRSSTTALPEFIISFLGRIFTLLENLPDASRVRSGSPEENVINSLPACFTPFLAALSPELFDLALDKIAHFVGNHVIHQARDAMAFICNALVKINPEKSLRRLMPELISSIRTEIEDNGAGSTRTTGTEVLPRDRGLTWNISLLSMCVVHVGDEVLKYKQELLDIAAFMQERCRGIPTVHISNFIHHLLLNLTVTYTTDYALYEPEEVQMGITSGHWGRFTDPKKIRPEWHVPTKDALDFAIELFQSEGTKAIDMLNALTSDDPPVKRVGKAKDWTDEVSRNLVLIRLLLSGVSVLFDARYDASSAVAVNGDVEMHDSPQSDEKGNDDTDELTLGDGDDEEGKTVFQYNTGYPLDRDSEQYRMIHRLRDAMGKAFHRVHAFLIEKGVEEVTCYSSLYNAYRSWFVDVGIERSAHVLDRVTRLLAADIAPFKFTGTRKQYPRPLLVRRANVYHLQRLRHNATPRPKSELDKQLLLDLAESSVSIYTEVRRTAQTAGESAVKCIIGARPLVIPPLLEAFGKAVKDNDYPRIKGAIFSLLFGSLAKTIGRDWRFTPTLIKSFIDVTEADKPSIQKLAANATFQIMDMAKPLERLVLLDQDTVESIASVFLEDEAEKVKSRIEKKRNTIKRKRTKVESKKAELSADLVEMGRTSHWKKASRTATIVISLSMRYDSVASEGMIDLVTRGSIDPHPSLRGLYAGGLIGIFALVQTRCLTNHDYKKYLLQEESIPDKIEVPTRSEDPNWTKDFLSSFAKPEAKYYVDHDYPGWLVWDKKMPAYTIEPQEYNYDKLEMKIRKQIGKIMDRHWFSTYFAYMKQEPRDHGADRFRMSSAMTLTGAFDLMFQGLTTATFEDIKDLTQSVYADGSDKHQHRATAEIFGAMLCEAHDLSSEQRMAVWDYVFPIVRGIFQDGLTPENSSYWNTFLHLVLSGKDVRRNWPLVEWLTDFRLDMTSNAAFKESSKIQMLNLVVADAGWHFQLEKPILEDFMNHLDHPYKGVREVMGQVIAGIQRTRYHESFPSVEALITANNSSSSVGLRPYQLTLADTAMTTSVFDRLEAWRLQRKPGDQQPTPYTMASKTVLIWLDATLSSYECTQLVPLFPSVFLQQLLHMMDIKEDPELQALAYHVFRHLPNIPHRAGEDEAFIAALIRIGRTSPSWHQRLRILINIQVVYFRRLFLMSEDTQRNMFDCVADMLGDAQHEVRLGASTTLSGMIRCSPLALRNQVVESLREKFTTTLKKNPLPKRLASRAPGTPTPEQNKLVLTRHAAVLGLGALVQAFPYTSPPPSWLPEVLATLGSRAAGDPGVVGKSVKQTLADFKKTRQDTWHVDVKAFEPEQLEDLEGVLWKSYFA